MAQPRKLPPIRPARAADVKAIHRIYAHHVLHGLASFEERAPSLAEMRRRFAAGQRGGFPYLVADWRGRVGGYAYASPYRARSAYRYSVENSVYIDEPLRGRGLGHALLTELIARCAALGYRQMVAVIGDSANQASIRLHVAHGFAQVGLLPSVGFKFGRWVDSVIMQRALGDGDQTLPE
jgi:phosphinothricin acetyltransferase